MPNTYSTFGDNIQIKKGGKNEYFKYYIARYEGDVCTLICGCESSIEVIERISKLLKEHELETK